jgi:tetratricopeptide (TPR) repeat protein
MRPPTSNPDWYRVRYGIAVERLNWALARDEDRDGLLNAAREDSVALLEAIDRRLGRRRGWGLRAWRDRLGRELDSFLRLHLKPSLLILLAGIDLARLREVESEEASFQALGAVNPIALARSVEEGSKAPSAGLSYNLACFYSQAGLLPLALEHLRHAIELTPPSAWSRLRTEIQNDPVLRNMAEYSNALFEDPLRWSGESAYGGGSTTSFI